MRSAVDYSLSLVQNPMPHDYLLWAAHLDDIVGLSNTIIYFMYASHLTEEAITENIISLLQEVGVDVDLGRPTVMRYLHDTFEEEYHSRRWAAWRTYQASVWEYVE